MSPTDDAARIRRSTPTVGWLGPLVLGLVATAATAVTFVQLARGVAGLVPQDLAFVGGPAGAFSIQIAIGGAVVAVIAGLIADLWAASATESTTRRLRGLTSNRLLSWNPLRIDSIAIGETVRTVVDSSQRAAAYRAGFFGPIIAAVAAPLVVLACMAIMVSWQSALILGVLIPLVPLIIVGAQRLFRSVSVNYRKASGQLSAAFFESVQGLGELALANAAERRGARLAALGERNRRQVMRLLAGNQVVILAVELAFGLLVTCAATALAAVGAANGSLTPANALAVVALSVLMTGPVSVVGQFFYIGMTGRAAEAQLAALVTAPTGLEGTTSAAPTNADAPLVATQTGEPDSDQPILEFCSVTAGYGDGPDVLRDVNFRLDRGETLAIVGPSGSGKSTILALSEKLLAPRHGRIVMHGRDIAEHSRPRVLDTMAIVSQTTTLFSGTIADNLRLARPDATPSELWDALASANLADEVRGFPLGLDHPVGERGLALSGGQAQRISIARALLRDADLLLLDEPSSSVDLHSEARIAAALVDLTATRSTVIVTHRPGILGPGTRILRLDDDGRVVEQ